MTEAMAPAAASTLAKRKGRDSALELLRILAMVLIVCHHFSVHSGLPLGGDYTGAHPFNVLWAQWLAYGGKLGVDIFVMISGYFLAAKCAHLKSLLMLVLTTAFYGGIIYCLYVIDFMGGQTVFALYLINLLIR